MNRGLLFSAALLLLTAADLWAAGRVEMVLATEANNAGLAVQPWYRLLTDLKVGGLQIRGIRPGDKIGIDVQGSAAQPIYKVTGLLTERNELQVPGGRFTLRDQAALAAWLERLRQEGPPGSSQQRLPFGVSEAQLKELNAALSPAVDFSTKGMSRSEALASIRRQIKIPIVADGGLDAALQSAGPIGDELQGLSSGTSLAALLRPAALALAPRKDRQGRLELAIVRPAAGVDIWPVGLSAEADRQQVLPGLFQSINVEIEDNPLPQALQAIAGRLEVPVLMDHNSLALERIDIAKENVSLPATKLSYSLILRKLLGQAKLVGELRTDEAGKPFLWITPYRRQRAR